jgi:hydrogenase assembly chaperone HypC/HupF
MCFGDVARIESIVDRSAQVLTTKGQRTVSLDVLSAGGQKVSTGDWVVISMGFALDVIDEHRARDLVRETSSIAGSVAPDTVFAEVFR